ncbi:unnamed protein product [Sphenostylis stenocarpa]|uniref:Uncharacterized protein n=1 Tax=Sphenostylis stenocarpa TaxID=92480 RepID=A0AA86SBF4_9FABA|nr:unnamed protein product [Sphenostylis stenocarpa]
MGGCEGEIESDECKIPRLPLLNPPTMHSPERSGMKTPPLFTSASVPFGWEEEPGKPRPCTALVSFSNPTPKCLELPPRLLADSQLNSNNNKLSSPTTVLEGPYPYVATSSCHSLSFRISEDCYGSFGAERGQLGTMVLNQGVGIKEKQKGWFGSWREKTLKREASGGSHVFPSSVDKDPDNVGTIEGTTHKKVRNMRKRNRSGSFTNPFYTKSSVWTTMYEGLKRVVPWSGKKLKKYGCGWP